MNLLSQNLIIYFSKKRLQENYNIIKKIEEEIKNNDAINQYEAKSFLTEVVTETPNTPDTCKKRRHTNNNT